MFDPRFAAKQRRADDRIEASLAVITTRISTAYVLRITSRWPWVYCERLPFKGK